MKATSSKHINFHSPSLEQAKTSSLKYKLIDQGSYVTLSETLENDILLHMHSANLMQRTVQK
jgi:hypothetical protein